MKLRWNKRAEIQNKEKMEQADQLFQKLSAHDRIQKMKAYRQHGKISTYHHVVSVTRTCLKLNRALGVGADETQLVRGSLFHDYYLYDWHHKRGEHFHGFRHPFLAAEKAERDFGLSDRERNMIHSHMWPLTLFHMPNCREAWLLCAADKWVSLRETLLER